MMGANGTSEILLIYAILLHLLLCPINIVQNIRSYLKSA